MIKLILFSLAMTVMNVSAHAAEPTPKQDTQHPKQSSEQSVQTIVGPGANASEHGYCDIFAIERGIGWTKSTNYSTFRVGTCEQSHIDSLTAASARAQMATLGDFDQIIVAGPYSYTMDINNSQIRNPYISLGNLRFSQVSVSSFTVWDAITHIHEAKRWLSQNTAYNPVRTTGDVDYVWFAGRKVHLLINGRQEHFVMTGVLDEVKNGKQGIHLSNMGEFMNLPDGWRFETKILDRVLSMNSRGIRKYEFERLIDEFGNLYIRIPYDPDLFKKSPEAK